MTIYYNIFQLWWPLAIVFICVVSSLTKATTGETLIKIYDIISSALALPKLNISGSWASRAVILAISCAFSIYALFRDYSFLFPSRMRVEVLFDSDGIFRTTQSFDKNEKIISMINKNSDGLRLSYNRDLNRRLSGALTEGALNGDPGRVSGSGEVSFIVSRQDSGMQKYRISSAGGTITYKDSAKTNSQSFDVKFDLLKTDSNIIDVSLKQFLFDHFIVIVPEFRQYSKTLTDTTTLENVITATKIQFFPYPDIGRTLYLIRSDSGGLVPIGYGLYDFN